MRSFRRVVNHSLGGASLPPAGSSGNIVAARQKIVSRVGFCSMSSNVEAVTSGGSTSNVGLGHNISEMAEEAERPMAHENVDIATITDGSSLCLVAASATFAGVNDENFWHGVARAAMRLGPKVLKISDLLQVVHGARKSGWIEDAEFSLHLFDRILQELGECDGSAFVLAAELNRTRPLTALAVSTTQAKQLTAAFAKEYVRRLKSSQATPTLVASGARAIVQNAVPHLNMKETVAAQASAEAAGTEPDVNVKSETTTDDSFEDLIEEVVTTSTRILREHPTAFNPRQLVNLLVAMCTAPEKLVPERASLIRAISRQLVILPTAPSHKPDANTANVQAGSSAEIISHTNLQRPMESKAGKRPTLPKDVYGAQLADIMWSLQQANVQDEALVFAASASLRKPHILNTLKPKQIIKVVSALRKFKYQLTVLLDLLCVQSRKVLKEFTIAELGQLMEGLGSLNVKNEILSTRSSRRVRAATQEEWDALSPDEAVSVFLGFGRMHVRDEELFAKAGDTIQKLFDMGHFRDVHYFTLVRLVFAHAQVRIQKKSLLDSVSYLLYERFDEASNADILWYLQACGKLDYQYPVLIQAIQKKLEDEVETLPVFDVLKISKNFEKLGIAWATLEAHVGKILPNELRRGDRMLAPLRPKNMEKRKKARARKNTW